MQQRPALVLTHSLFTLMCVMWDHPPLSLCSRSTCRKRTAFPFHLGWCALSSLREDIPDGRGNADLPSAPQMCLEKIWYTGPSVLWLELFVTFLKWQHISANTGLLHLPTWPTCVLPDQQSITVSLVRSLSHFLPRRRKEVFGPAAVPLPG